MSSSCVRFVMGFGSGAALAALLNLSTYLATRGAQNGDRFEIIGFPFTFRRLGGIAGIYEFNPAALFADIVVGLVIAILVGIAFRRAGKKGLK